MSDAAGLAVGLVDINGGSARGIASLTELTVPTQPDRIFQIRSVGRGGALLEARSGGSLVSSVQIAVLQSKSTSISFKILKDSAGHSTNHIGCSNIPEWLKTARAIWAQANVELTFVDCTTFEIPGDAAVIPDPLKLSKQLLDLAQQRVFSVTTADCYVFFVWDLPEQEPDDKTMGYTTIFVLIDQETLSSSPVLAHELGHLFRLSHETGMGDPDNLMTEGAAGRQLNKSQILSVNPAA